MIKHKLNIKMKTNIIRGSYWNHYEATLPVNDSIAFIFAQFKLEKTLKQFWDEVVSEMKNDQLFSIILKLHFDDGSIVSISFLQIVDSTQFDELLEVFKFYIDKKSWWL